MRCTQHHERRAPRRRVAAFTLIELMVVAALIVIIATLAAPSLRDMILMQRLRGVNAQLVTDLAFARSEAISRGVYVGVRFQSTGGADAMSCYILNTRMSMGAPLCDCTAAAGSRCTDVSQTTEIRTVQIPTRESVLLALPAGADEHFTLDPRTGGLKLAPSDFSRYDTSGFVIETFIDSLRKLRTALSVSGRVTVCTPSGSRAGGTPCT